MRPPIQLTIITLLALAGSQTSWAQAGQGDNAEGEEAGPAWKARAHAGLLMTTGNSSTTTLSSGLHGSRDAGKNKVVLDLAGAFARSTIGVAADVDGDGFISESEFRRVTKTTSQAWQVRPRYDRALSEHDALYLAAVLASDKPAGKTIVGSGQLGYSRSLLTSTVHALTLEAGYDFSYEDLEAAGSPSLSIHSLRIFAGYEGTLSTDTSLTCAAEGLFNLNKLNTAAATVDRFGDNRVESKLALITKLYSNLSFSFSFLARYDSDPAPRPNLALPYTDGFRPLADRLDTRTEAALIISFL